VNTIPSLGSARAALLPLALIVGSACSGDAESKDAGPTTVDTGAPSTELPDVYINEFMASNSMSHPDEGGAFPDWIELYNASDVDADLSGWWLTDDNTDIFKWQIPDGVSILPGGFIVMFCDRDLDEGPLHVDFELDADGEDIGLYGPNVLDNPEIDAIDAYGLQLADVSLARVPDGSPTFVAVDGGTPGVTNGTR